jgi:DNA-binding MarR family transcriptional regulator
MRDRSSSVKRQPSPHPVDDVRPEGTNVLFDVWLVSRGTTGLLDAALASTGLSADEFGIYSVLTSSDTMTPTDLARWMAAPATTVSSHIKRIEGRGHLVRERNPADGRSYVLRLTDAGRTAHRDAGARFLPVLDAVLDALGRREPAVRAALADLRIALDTVAGA